MPSVDETFMNVCNLDRLDQHKQQVDGPAKDLYDLTACSDILDIMGLDNQTKFQVFELLRKQDKEMRKALFVDS